MPTSMVDTGRTHLLTVSVEDYFHVAAFERAVRAEYWDHFVPRLAENLGSVLELFARYAARATFFVPGLIAERQPELVRMIAAAGHEVASGGYVPRDLTGKDREELRFKLRRTREALEKASGSPVIGYRSPRWLDRWDLWVLDLLAEEGYLYDSSINPVLRRFAGAPEFHGTRAHDLGNGRSLWEFPISTVGLFGCRVAISGGNYIRQIPHEILSRATSWWHEHKDEPLVFYFMPWELDRQQPHVTSLSRWNKLRHYRNLEKTRWVLEDYFRRYRFESIGDRLGVPRTVPPALEGAALRGPIAEIASGPERLDRRAPVPISLVVPLYNEEQNVAYLGRTLAHLRAKLEDLYRIHLVLVDDGSRDGTWAALQEWFGADPACRLLHRESNEGVASAIMEGIRAAPTEIVCSIDCDGSYDPADLPRMIPLLENADLVTASPYHPQGCVFNVPGWRLLLSRNLSRIYSALLGERLYTFTSCFRVYRRSAVLPVRIAHGGFLGIAELLILLRAGGGRVVEFPTTLGSRVFGVSKMKTLRTIRGHLGLLAQLVPRRRRLARAAAAPAARLAPVPGPPRDRV